MRHVFLWACLVAVLVWIAGFWQFAGDVRAPAQTPPQADAIVALTGGSIDRLTTGVRLLSEHKGGRLLISGVNRLVTDDELLEGVLDVDPELARCCIDLGRGADDTLGNASETAVWAREHGFRSLILVTDDYHMPRSQLELSLALPEAEIHAYPIRTRYSDPKLWRSDLGAAARLAGEYMKYLVIRGREALLGIGQTKPKQT